MVSSCLRYRGISPHEVLKSYPKLLFEMGVEFRLPVLDFSKSEIFELLNDEENILYSLGFDRVGCFPCLASGDKWKEMAFEFDDTGRKHYKIVKEIEVAIGRSVFKGKKYNNLMNPGCAVCSI